MPSFIDRDQLQVVQPYMAPTDAIASTFQTKLNYWAADAAQIKSAANQYLGLDLTNQENQEKLKNYIPQINDQLKKLTYSDLSVGDNQSQAMNIFKPITSDENIMGDHALTEHTKSQLAIADSYRNMNGGKEYSDDNRNILLMRLNEFRNDSASNWRQHYGTRSFYSPYYDYSKEVKDAMENFVPNHTVSQHMTDAKGNQLPERVTIENKTAMANDVRRYLSGVLSSKAKTQLGIEGYTHLAGNDGDLAKAFTGYALNNIHSMNAENDDLTGRIAGSKDPEAVKGFQKQVENNQKEIKNIQNGLDAISKGDFSFIKQHRAGVAAAIFTDQYLHTVANSFQHIDYSEKMDANQVWLSQFTQANENARLSSTINWQKQKFGAENEREWVNTAIDAEKNGLSYEMDAYGHIKLSGGGTSIKNWTGTNIPGGADQSDVTKSVSDIYKLEDGYKAGIAQADYNLKDFLERQSGQVIKPQDFEAAKNQYLGEQHNAKKKDQAYLDYIETTQANNSLLKGVSNLKAKIDTKLSEIDKTGQLQKIPVITTPDGTKITAAGLLSDMVADKATITSKNVYGGSGADNTEYTIQVGGKTYSGLPESSNLKQMYDKVKGFYNTISSNGALKQKVSTLMDDVINQDQWFTSTNAKDKAVVSATNFASKAFGLKPEQIHIKSFNGNDKFEVAFSDSSADFEKFMKNKDWSNTPGSDYTITKVKGSGDGAAASYIIKSNSFQPFNRTSTISTHPYLGNAIKSQLDDYGIKTSDNIDIHGNKILLRFSVVRSKDEHTPNKYEVWYGRDLIRTSDGKQSFNDFGSAWEYAAGITSMGKNAKGEHDADKDQEEFDKYIKIHVR
jgi:hypothetical protein